MKKIFLFFLFFLAVAGCKEGKKYPYPSPSGELPLVTVAVFPKSGTKPEKKKTKKIFDPKSEIWIKEERRWWESHE